MLTEMLKNPEFKALIERMKSQYIVKAMARDATDDDIKSSRDRFHLLDEIIGEMASATLNKD